MKYVAWGYGKEARKVSITIDDARFKEIAQAKRLCLFALEIEEKISLLIDNYLEFELQLLRLAEESLLRPNREHSDAMQERLSLDRLIANVLMSCRLYIDQTSHGISTFFGSESEQMHQIKRFKNDLYDTHQGYRIMEALRNHVQHSGLPVHVILYQQRGSTEELNSYTEWLVIPQCEWKTLAENPDFKKSVLEEMKKCGEQVDLRGPLREYLACLLKLHGKLREMIAPPFDTARKIYEEAAKEYSTLNGEPVSHSSLIELGDDGLAKEELSLTTNFIEYYDRLFKQNSINERFQASTASNSNERR